MSWQPIETAPPHGLILLTVVAPDGERRTLAAEASYKNCQLVWQSTVGWCGYSPLHGAWWPVAWMPLPQPLEGGAPRCAEIERLTAAHHAAIELSNTMHGRWIAAEAERDALHAAVCQAVALLNRSPGTASCPEGREAHTILRQSLVAHADAYMDQPVTEAEREAVARKHRKGDKP